MDRASAFDVKWSLYVEHRSIIYKLPSMRMKLFMQLNGKTYTVESAISGNILSIYKNYIEDNPEETVMSDSVETIRTQPEMAKI